MKKRYDAVIVGGGTAGYALAALCAKAGDVLFFENEDPPADPPWERPLFAAGDSSVWKRFVQDAGWKEGASSGYRFQVLAGRERDAGTVPPAAADWDPAPWLGRQLEWPAWYVRWWRDVTGGVPVPEVAAGEPWSALPLGFPPRDKGVIGYLSATRKSLQTPEGDVGALLRKLRAAAAAAGAEFLPIGRFDGIEDNGVRVQGAGKVIETPRIAACLDLGQWTQAPGLGPLPRGVFKTVKPAGVRVRARWACDEAELPVGLAARGWWADEPKAFFEVTGKGSESALSVWTFCADATRTDPQEVAGRLLGVVKRYCPFFRGSVSSAQVESAPVWQSVARDGRGVPPQLSKRLGYAGPQSFPGWGVEGELAAVLRLHRLWYPPVTQ